MLGEKWDDIASTLEDAKATVWAELDYDAGVTRCVEKIASVLDPIGEGGGTIVEIGCGIGRLLVPLALRWEHAYLKGIDVSRSMLGHAVKAVFDAGVMPRVTLYHGSWQQWSRTVGACDAVYSFAVLQHIPEVDQRGYLREVARSLTPGGLLMFQFCTEADVGPWSNPVPSEKMAEWVEDAGMLVESVEVGGFLHDEWAWLTAVR